jgi:hypothetical protein
MKAKALRMIALLLLALLTAAGPCPPPDPTNTVYVVHEATQESGHVQLGHALLYSDRVDGMLTLQFSRDGEGDFVDGGLSRSLLNLLGQRLRID